MAKSEFKPNMEDVLKLREEALNEKEKHLDLMLNTLKENQLIEDKKTSHEKDLENDMAVQNWVQKVIISSKTYKGRTVTVSQRNNGNLNIHQYSEHLAKNNKEYKPLDIEVSEETFMLILETLMFSAKRLKLDKKEILKRLTDGKDSDEIEFIIRECSIVN